MLCWQIARYKITNQYPKVAYIGCYLIKFDVRLARHWVIGSLGGWEVIYSWSNNTKPATAIMLKRFGALNNVNHDSGTVSMYILPMFRSYRIRLMLTWWYIIWHYGTLGAWETGSLNMAWLTAKMLFEIGQIVWCISGVTSLSCVSLSHKYLMTINTRITMTTVWYKTYW